MSNVKVIIFRKINYEIIEQNYELSKLNLINYDKLDFQDELKVKVESMNYSIEVKKLNNIYYVLKEIDSDISTKFCEKEPEVIREIENFINHLEKCYNEDILLKLSFESESRDVVRLNNFFYVNNSKIHLIHHYSKFENVKTYYHFFVPSTSKLIAFSQQDATTFTINSSSNLKCKNKKIKAVHWSNGSITKLEWNTESNNKSDQWAYNVIDLNSGNTTFLGFKDIIANYNIPNCYLNFNKYFSEHKGYSLDHRIIKKKKSGKKGKIKNSIDEKLIRNGDSVEFSIEPNLKVHGYEAEEFVYKKFRKSINHQLRYFIYLYVEKNQGKILFSRKCYNSGKYLTKFKCEFKLKKGHNHFFIDSKLNQPDVDTEKLGVVTFSQSGGKDLSAFCSTGGSIHLVRTKPFTSYIPLNKQNIIEIKNNDNDLVKINDNLNEDKNTLIKINSKLGGRNDEPTGKEDLLDYKSYAEVLSEIIIEKRIAAPVTIGIYSSWGSGKSFLLSQIKENIIKKREKEKPKYCCDKMKCFLHDNMKYYIPLYRNYWKTRKLNYVFIEFNAWEYSGTDVLWAGLVKCMYDTLEQEFGQTFFRLYLHWFKPKESIVSNCIYFICNLFFLGLGILFYYSFQDYLTSLISILSGFAITLVSLYPKLRDLFNNIVRGQSKLLEAQVKQINSKVGFMAVVRENLDNLCGMLDQYKCQPIIFIDDLDRCTHDKAVQVLNAVKLLLSSSNSRFYTFLAIDPRLVVKAIESTYRETIIAAGITGYEFIDKIVQIPFVIPKQDNNDKQNFVKSLLNEINEGDIRVKQNEQIEIPQLIDPKLLNQVSKFVKQQSEIIDNVDYQTDSDDESVSSINNVIEEKINIKEEIPLNENIIKISDNINNTEEKKEEFFTKENISDEDVEINFEEIDDTEDKTYSKLITENEMEFFSKFSIYLNSNGRRINRIINMYMISKNYYNKKLKYVDPEIMKKILSCIIFSEQWPYRLSFILIYLEILFNKKKLISNEKFIEISDYNKSLKETKIIEVYSRIKKFLYFNENLIKISYSDSRDDQFDSFLKEIDFINCYELNRFCKKFIFNLNPAIKISILKEIHLINLEI